MKKNKKKTFLSDTFEQLSDTAVSTVKKTGASVRDTFDPITSLNENGGVNQQTAEKVKEQLEQKGKNHTPIDLGSFEKNYKKQDEQKAEELRTRLFKLVKEGEKETFEATKKKESEQKQLDEEEEEQKKRKEQEEEKKKREQAPPKGKQRRNIFSPKKKAQEQHAEYRPSSGQG